MLANARAILNHIFSKALFPGQCPSVQYSTAEWQLLLMEQQHYMIKSK
jgi:hypothetical protein